MKFLKVLGYILLMIVGLFMIGFSIYSTYTIITTLYSTGNIFVLVWYILGLLTVAKVGSE